MASTRWRLDGQRALVTGASAGIGLAICRELLGFGAQVLMVARDAALLEQARADLEDGGVNTLFLGMHFLRWVDGSGASASRVPRWRQAFRNTRSAPRPSRIRISGAPKPSCVSMVPASGSIADGPRTTGSAPNSAPCSAA